VSDLLGLHHVRLIAYDPDTQSRIGG
jgi:hypothetical protein